LLFESIAFFWFSSLLSTFFGYSLVT
jgi:hypothetical protein